MDPDDKPPTTTATEARQGQMLGRVRWVLLLGLILVIVAFGFAWVFHDQSYGP